MPGGAWRSEAPAGSPNVPALQAISIVFVTCSHALTRVATHCRRFAPLFLTWLVEVCRRAGPEQAPQL